MHFLWYTVGSQIIILNQYVTRRLQAPKDSFFLLGPRGVGKTTWLSHNFPNALRVDLLENRTYLELLKDPSLLAAKLGHLPAQSWVIIDEIQKVPELLDEVHRLIESKSLRFALTASSARKLRRAGTNLLAGRAITRHMFALTSLEWLKDFQLDDALAWGGLPRAVSQPSPIDFLEAYFTTYIREEIREEGLVRRIELFARFLEIMGHLNGQVINVENISRESGVKRVTLDSWLSILEDTLIGIRLPGWRPGFKVRESAHPKFYWFDPGVARAAAGLLFQTLDRTWLGWCLETWVLHELRAWSHYNRLGYGFFYYALPSDNDIDIIIETRKSTPRQRGEIIGIEVKLSKKWDRSWEKSLRELRSLDKIDVKRMIGIYCGSEILTFDDFTVYPVEMFLERLESSAYF